MKVPRSIPNNDAVRVTERWSMLGQAVQAIKSRMIVDRQIGKAYRLKHGVDLGNLADAVSVNCSVDGIDAIAGVQDSNTTGHIVKIVFGRNVGFQPFRNFRVKVGRLVVAIENSFHGFFLAINPGIVA